jgi:hypothetical protein
MTTSFQETNTAGACSSGQYCSSVTAATGNVFECSVGGTAGSSQTVNAAQVAATRLVLWFELVNIDDYDGGTGNWAVRLNVTSGNHQITWDTFDVCRVNSSCTNQEQLANVSSLNENLGATGVKTHIANQTASTTIDPGDKIIICIGLTNSGTMAQSCTIDMDQIITAPGTISGDATAAYYQQYYKSVVSLMSKVKQFIKGLWEQRPADLKAAA